MLRVLLSRIRATFRNRSADEDIDDELRAHLDMLQERFSRRGMEPKEAFYAARRQLGGLTQLQQELRDRRGLPVIDLMRRDIRQAIRRLGRSKPFTACAALTLALGIGATTAVFAVLDALVLKPLPYAEPGRPLVFPAL